MKKIVLNLAVLSFFSNIVLIAKATDLVDKNKYQEITKKDDRFLTKTREDKNIEEGKVVSFTLKDNDISNDKLAIEFNAIIKCLEKEFNLKNGKKIEDIIKNANVVSTFNNKKTISFEILMNEDLKNQLNNFLKTTFNANEIEKTKDSLKQIINKNFENVKLDNVADYTIEKINKEIEQQKSTNSFENFFSFLKSSQEKEVEKQVREKMVEKLEEEKKQINKFKNEITKEKLNSLVDLIESADLNGNFKRADYSMSKISTNFKN